MSHAYIPSSDQSEALNFITQGEQTSPRKHSQILKTLPYIS